MIVATYYLKFVKTEDEKVFTHSGNHKVQGRTLAEVDYWVADIIEEWNSGNWTLTELRVVRVTGVEECRRNE